MKTYNIILVAIMAIFLMGCKSGDTIAPKDNKIQGVLGEYFEVVDKDCKVNDGKVSIEIKRIKEGLPAPWVSGMEIGCDEGQFKPTFVIEFLDEDDNVVSKASTDIALDMDDLRTITSLGVNESSTIQFECADNAVSFKMSSIFEVNGGKGMVDEETEVTEETVTLEGKIGPYSIIMTLHIDAYGVVTGAYKYKGKHACLYLLGQKDSEHIEINEFTDKGIQSGTFDGTYENGRFMGMFRTKSGNYHFDLKLSNAENIDFSKVDFSSFNPVYIENYDDDYSDGDSYVSNDTSGSDDWDAWLDSYEQYVNKLISCAKKAAKGDPSALTEYASLLQKAQELQEKLASAEGELSSSQLARYNRINQKMLTAIQNM